MGHSDGSTPAGHAGARGRLFNASGVLSCEGSTKYNTSTTGISAPSCMQYANGAWYGYGVTYAWNGNSYSAIYTFRTSTQYS